MTDSDTSTRGVEIRTTVYSSPVIQSTTSPVLRMAASKWITSPRAVQNVHKRTVISLGMGSARGFTCLLMDAVPVADVRAVPEGLGGSESAGDSSTALCPAADEFRCTGEVDRGVRMDFVDLSALLVDIAAGSGPFRPIGLAFGDAEENDGLLLALTFGDGSAGVFTDRN